MTGYRVPGGEITIPLPGSTLEQVPDGAETLEFAGAGRIVTYSVVHVPSTRFKDVAPYTLAVVELHEGARLLALLDQGEPAIGGPVRFTHSDEYGHHFVLA
ncbi:MAG: OB-fold domain-containing protein [Chloroflexi bacterium]|nr:OB-fold domain-containing protein [Chloroflexota bacterium]